MLIDLVLQSGALANSCKGSKPEWPVMTALLVSIYRDESAKMKAIDSFNMAAGYGAGTSIANNTDDDEGDFD
jgi:hypothetical protein